jgi:imidazole glycerol phosphate synthase glutamine amidotransferase subunit
MSLIGILNYGAGNLGSVRNALKRLAGSARFVAGPEELDPRTSPFDKLLFPGDGNFGATMQSLEKSGYGEALKQWLRADRPFLGICIGLQVLFESSEEAPGVAGLGILKGSVKKFSLPKTPLIGWNQTRITGQGAAGIFKTTPQNSFFYYIHSYYVSPADTSVVAARSDYGLDYCAAIERGNMAAVQFHPEKSGAVGLALLKLWLEK